MKILHLLTSEPSSASRAAERLHNALRTLGHESTMLVLSRPSRGLAGKLPACDVLNLHDICDAIDYARFLRNLPKGVPVVWRLTDAEGRGDL